MTPANDEGLTSIDFLVGFTIFCLALIVAAGMVPGMLAKLQSATIDYDGVAYRTSVILAEDPGWFEDASGGTGSRWESRPDDAIQRMGLAVSKDTPDILSSAKITRFFNRTKDPAFYRDRLFFSDMPYSFNITLKAEDDFNCTLGDRTPAGEYGYIRRAVLVKNASFATLNFSRDDVLGDYADPTTAPGSTSTFNVSLNFSELLDRPPAYRIDPFGEEITITLVDLSKTFNGTTTPKANLNSVTLWRWSSTSSMPSHVYPDPPDASSHLYVDGYPNECTLPVNVTQNLTLVLEPGFFTGKAAETSVMDLRFTFDNNGYPATNTTIKGTFDYTPSDSNVTVPALKPAVLEVAVW
ncbi:MAG: hypothetical protein PWP08_126 [Methanofollis sp.]|nr:hypothetical protein [Methanofollis sp.]